jgi:hypothetical protein
MRWIIAILPELCGRGNTSRNIKQMYERLRDYIEKSSHKNTVHGVHIHAMKLMRNGQNKKVMMLLEPAIHMNHSAFILYLDILLFGRVGILPDLQKCEQLLYRRLGIDDNAVIYMTKLLNLRDQHYDPNLFGLLYLLRKFNPIKYTCFWKESATVNAHLLAWSRESLYGELALLCTIMIDRRHYVKLLGNDDIITFKTSVSFGTKDDGCPYDNYASLARQIDNKYKHPFAQHLLIKNLKLKYDKQVVPPEILCEMNIAKQKASLQGFDEGNSLY